MNGIDEKYFKAAAEEIPAMLSCIEGWAGEVLSPKQLVRLLLAAEEACSNIVLYAYEPEADERYLILACKVYNDSFSLKMIDGGRPFDPFNGDFRNVTTKLDTMKPGGFGRIFMKKFVDCATYRREQEQNVLRLTVKRTPAL